MGLMFQPAGTISEENLYILLKASIGIYQWKSWCKEKIESEAENWPIIANLYNKEHLIVKVVEVNGYLIYIPQLPVEELLTDCQVTGNYEQTVNKVAEFYQDVIMLSAERLKRYQVILNSFVEFALK